MVDLGLLAVPANERGKRVWFFIFAPSLTVITAHPMRRSEGSAAPGQKLMFIVKQDVQAGCRN